MSADEQPQLRDEEQEPVEQTGDERPSSVNAAVAANVLSDDATIRPEPDDPGAVAPPR